MSRVLVALLALVAVLSVVLWRVAATGTKRSVASSAQVDSAPRERTDGAEPVPPAVLERPAADGSTPHESAPSATPQPESARTEASVAEREAELARAHRVEGRVLFPEGTPLDEEIFVTADGRAFEDGNDQRVRVERDGTFRVAFSEKTRSGRLELEGHYLYLTEAARWEPDDPQPVVLEPQLGGRILARVIAPDGVDATRIGGVLRLSVNPSALGGPWYEERAKRPLQAESATAFDALVPGEELQLLYDGDAFVGNSAPVKIVAGQARAIEIPLRPGVTVAGRVLDEERRPLASVAVNANLEGGLMLSPDGNREVETKADGSFRLGALVPGKVRLRAYLAGFVPAFLELGMLEEGAARADLELVLARGGSISGIVRWPDGTPAEGRVTLVPHLESRPFPPPLIDSVEGKADATGRFRITGLSEGTYLVRASAIRTEEIRVTSKLTGRERDKKKRTQWTAELDGVTPDGAELALVLSNGESLSGRVLDDLGAPLSDFRVRADRVRDERTLLVRDDDASRSFRDANGRFVLEGLAPGAWRLFASAEGHAEIEGVEVEVSAGAEVELRLPREAIASGVVLDADGAPCTDAVVNEATGLSFVRFDALGDEQNHTDENGRFRLGGMRAGRTVLVARGSAGAPSEPLELELVAGEERSGLVLRLRPGAMLFGEVVGRDGLPESDVQVDLYGNGFSKSVQTVEGRFEVRGLPPGVLRVSAQTRDGLRLSQSVTLSEGQASQVHLAAPRTALVRLHGRVSAAGEPLAASVFASRADRKSGESVSSSSPPTQTGSEGTYELTLPGPGRYDVTFHSFGPRSFSWRTSIDVPEVAELAHDVAIPCGRVSGRVTDSSRSGLAGIRVQAQSLRYEGGPNGSARTETEDDGGYELLLPAGTHSLTAGGARSPGAEGERQFAAAIVEDVAVAEGARVGGIDFVLSEGGTLAGLVRTPEGAPASRAQLWSSTGEGPRLIGSTGGDGSFRIGGLAAGTTWISASASGRATRGTRVAIVAGETAEVELALAPATMLWVRVREASGAFTGAELEVRDEEGIRQPSRRSEEGTGFGPLPAGRYTVRGRREGRSAERVVEIAGREPEVRLDLVLE